MTVVFMEITAKQEDHDSPDSISIMKYMCMSFQFPRIYLRDFHRVLRTGLKVFLFDLSIVRINSTVLLAVKVELGSTADPEISPMGSALSLRQPR